MKFDGVKKVDEGRFISRYDLYYTTEDDKKKVYEIISRNKDIKTLEDIRNEKTDGVVIVATDEADEHILINKEYRMSVGDYVYNFPAGLIDEGETPEVAAKRELKEETGLDLIVIEDKLYDSYSAIGFPMRQMLWLSEKHLEIFRQALQRLRRFRRHGIQNRK